MAHKVLIALDSSPGAWGAVEYVAEAFGKTPGVAGHAAACVVGSAAGFLG